MAKLKFTHCSECGTAYTSVKSFPRECDSCSAMKWINPTPVAVLIQPILSINRIGIAVGRRAIQPGAGLLGLIGGFVDMGDESIEGAATREFQEETGLTPKCDPRLSYSAMNQLGNIMMFCLVDKPMSFEEWSMGIPCPETESLDVLWEDTWEDRLDELAFPLHKDAISKWFRGELK